MDVRTARYETVAALLTPGIGSIWVQYDVHGLVVGSPVELLLFTHICDVHLHLFEFAELGEPWLRLVDSYQLRHLK